MSLRVHVPCVLNRLVLDAAFNFTPKSCQVFGGRGGYLWSFLGAYCGQNVKWCGRSTLGILRSCRKNIVIIISVQKKNMTPPPPPPPPRNEARGYCSVHPALPNFRVLWKTKLRVCELTNQHNNVKDHAFWDETDTRTRERNGA